MSKRHFSENPTFASRMRPPLLSTVCLLRQRAWRTAVCDAGISGAGGLPLSRHGACSQGVGAVFGRADTRTESALRRDLSRWGEGSPPTEKRKADSKPLTDHRYKPHRLPLSRDFVFRLPRPLRSSDPPPLCRGENQRLPCLSSSSVPSFLLCHHPSASRALRAEGSLGE